MAKTGTYDEERTSRHTDCLKTVYSRREIEGATDNMLEGQTSSGVAKNDTKIRLCGRLYVDVYFQ